MIELVDAVNRKLTAPYVRLLLDEHLSLAFLFRPASFGRLEQFKLFFKADAHKCFGISLDSIRRYLYNTMIIKDLKNSEGLGLEPLVHSPDNLT